MTAVSVIRTAIIHFDQKRIIKIIDLNNGDVYDDYINMLDVRDNRVPGRGSVLTKAYYKGKYKLKNGSIVTLTTRTKLKLGKATHGSTDPIYKWRRIVPGHEPLTVAVHVSYSTSTGKTRVTHSYTDTLAINH